MAPETLNKHKNCKLTSLFTLLWLKGELRFELYAIWYQGCLSAACKTLDNLPSASHWRLFGWAVLELPSPLFRMAETQTKLGVWTGINYFNWNYSKVELVFAIANTNSTLLHPVLMVIFQNVAGDKVFVFLSGRLKQGFTLNIFYMPSSENLATLNKKRWVWWSWSNYPLVGTSIISPWFSEATLAI